MGKVTLKIVQKYEARTDGKKNVRLRITADRVSRFFSTSIDLTPSQFNPKGRRELANWIRPAHPNQAVYNDSLKKLYDRALQIVESLGQAATADQVRQKLETPGPSHSPEQKPVIPGFIAYAGLYLLRRGESATTDTYSDAVKAFGLFLKNVGLTDIAFTDLTIRLLKEWRVWILANRANNTAWLYHSRLKSIYFQAIEDVEGLTGVPTVVTDPFRRVKIAKQRTKKNRLYEDEIERLAGLELDWGTSLRRARDIALMMYYAHGMRVGDALRLRLSNYVVIVSQQGEEHRLIYQMGKTGKPKNVLLPEQCIDLLAPYRQACSATTDTLFPYLRRVIDKSYDEYRLRQKVKARVAWIRMNLQKLAELAGVDKNLSAHVFRHSFADLARRNNMDVMEIKTALGHEQINTTQGYMEDMEESAVDKARDLFQNKPKPASVQQ